jgi:hypothetical protein
MIHSHNSFLSASLFALASIALAACSGAGVEFDEDFEAMELGEHEAALQNDGSGPAEDKCTTAMQDCYLDCSVTRYPESNDSVNNLNGMMREACLDSCDAANRTCTSTAMTRPSVELDVVGNGVLTIDPRPAITSVRASVASKPALQLAR